MQTSSWLKIVAFGAVLGSGVLPAHADILSIIEGNHRSHDYFSTFLNVAQGRQAPLPGGGRYDHFSAFLEAAQRGQTKPVPPQSRLAQNFSRLVPTRPIKNVTDYAAQAQRIRQYALQKR